MKAIKENTIVVIHLYNVGFFGGNREGSITIDGQYKVVTDLKEFILLKVGGYGNLTSFPEVKNSKPEILSESSYRFIHDALLSDMNRSSYRNEASDIDIKQFKKATRYKVHKGRISANIGYGDKVIDLSKNETFVVDGGHDVSYINRNFDYKLVDRELHPEPVTLKDFIAKNEAVDPFKKWTKLDAMPKKNKEWLTERFIINGETFNAATDYSGNRVVYFIQTPKGDVYQIQSSISAPFHDTIDILSGKVACEYKDGNPYNIVYKDIVHESDRTEWFHPNRYIKSTETSSYKYNTRLTHI